MNILICTHIRDEFEFLQKKFLKMFSENGIEVIIFNFQKSEDMLEYLSVSPDNPDIIILSFHGLDDNAKTKIKKITDTYRKAKIILISEEPEYTEEIFSLGISYFFRHPVSEIGFQKFKQCTENRWFNNDTKYFVLENKKSSIKITYSDILYVMSDKRKAVFYQSNGKEDSVYRKLDEIEEMLDERFIRCHQSYLINVAYIRGIELDGFLMIDNIFIPISQKKYWESKRKYIKYIKEQG